MITHFVLFAAPNQLPFTCVCFTNMTVCLTFPELAAISQAVITYFSVFAKVLQESYAILALASQLFLFYFITAVV